MAKKRIYVKPKTDVFEMRTCQMLMTSGVESYRVGYGTAAEESETELTWD